MENIISGKLFKAFLHCPFKVRQILRNEKGIQSEYGRCQILLHGEYSKAITTNINKLFSDYTYEAGVVLLAKGKTIQNKIILDHIHSCDSYSVKFDAILTTPKHYSAIVLGHYDRVGVNLRKYLGFLFYVLQQQYGKTSDYGYIVSGASFKKSKVKVKKLIREAELIIEEIKKLQRESPSYESKYFILNKHCEKCEFKSKCYEQAQKMGHISLLTGINSKSLNKLNKKGIFTLNQLSYIYRPKRRQKKSSSKNFIYKPELQAIAVRTKNIYIESLPNIEDSVVKFFFDVEGIPENNYYYLLGLLKVEEQVNFYEPFWINSKEEEEIVWNNFLSVVFQHPQAPIYHYGGYDLKAIRYFIRKYESCQSFNIETRLVNILDEIYGKVYFPTYGNGLKMLGEFLGFKWEKGISSGLQSIVWWHQWVFAGDITYKSKIISYNKSDCEALCLLFLELLRIKSNFEVDNNIEATFQTKKIASKEGEALHKNFTDILLFASMRYDESKVKLKLGSEDSSIHKIGKLFTKRASVPKGEVKPTKTILVRRKLVCPRCKVKLRPLKRDTVFFRVDLKHGANGIRKEIIKYIGKKSYCTQCYNSYNPPKISSFKRYNYGNGLLSWIAFKRVQLKMPFQAIADDLKESHGLDLAKGSISRLFIDFTVKYLSHEQENLQKLRMSNFIHVDETKLNIKGQSCYVWVFTDGIHVIFKLTETREASVVEQTLQGYAGTIISDFFVGYDSLPFQQQKCWVHLIRDINEDLWKEPYNEEYEQFVSELKGLIVPIFQAIQKFGLKTYHLNKFKPIRERFYLKNIKNAKYSSEITLKYQKRLKRYWLKLFTFMERDNIPWNNNMAERAIRHLAVQRKISGAFSSKGSKAYLTFLGMAQSCRFQNKSFLKFLLSTSKTSD